MAPGHVVQLYDDESSLVDALVAFAADGFGAGDSIVVIASAEHLVELETRLQKREIDLARARAQGRFVELGAARALERILIDGRPDPARFARFIGGEIARAAERSGRVRVFGDMVALLMTESQREAAVALEQQWNELARAHPLSLVCAYPLAAFGAAARRSVFQELCGEHAEVRPAGSYGALTSDDARARAIAELQRRVSELEAELALLSGRANGPR